MLSKGDHWHIGRPLELSHVTRLPGLNIGINECSALSLAWTSGAMFSDCLSLDAKEGGINKTLL